ncbi:MAG: YifB family Mg chelatase-like AAA ATPase [bacterium]
MSLAIVYSRAESGTDAPQVTVEVHLARGLPKFSIVGLPETAVKESRDRVRGAILNSNFEFPRQRIIVNLAPADLPKEGGRFDLPIAIGLLAASRQVRGDDIARHVFLGELALSGELRDIRGGLIVALSLRQSERTLVLPQGSASQAALVSGVEVLGATSLLQICAMLNRQESIPPVLAPTTSVGDAARHDATQHETIQHEDMRDVIGQPFAKRALEIAAAGAHSVLLSGPPGTGKTMLAARLPSILPAMSEREALETAAIESLGQGGFDPANWMRRPFRSPHHSASGAALIGGGGIPRPGEISLAHNGILFLDELPEFDRKVLEALREPLESGVIHISRVAQQTRYLANFLLVATCNPCPCGYLGDESGRCRCTPGHVLRYRARLSGPLLDRIDIQLEVPRIAHRVLSQSTRDDDTSATIRQRVARARHLQLQRQGKTNSLLHGNQIEHICALDAAGHQLLDDAMERLDLSARAYHRILKVARSIADLSQQPNITPEHLAVAIKLRCFDQAVPR